MRDGDHYVVTGQKIWCSFGQIGDFGELLVRTDPDVPKHKGISWLMLPMDLPGIEVRPLRTRARVLGVLRAVPRRGPGARSTCRVGEENDGWRVTNVTLSFERGTAFVSELVDAMRLVEELAPLRDATPATGASSGTSPPSSTRCGRSRSATSRSRRAVGRAAGRS